MYQEHHNAADMDRPAAKILILLIVINLVACVTEAFLGWLSRSAGLIADSVDMLAHVLLYGVSLCALGRTLVVKSRSFFVSGIVQSVFGAGMMAEVFRRGLLSGEPDPIYMIFAGLGALLANVASMTILTGYRGDRPTRSDEVWLFFKTEILGNLGVILAGGFVSLTASAVPDLLIGCLISAMIIRNGFFLTCEARKLRGYHPE